MEAQRSPAPAGTSLHILILSDRDWTHPQGGGTGTNLLSQVEHWLAWGHRVTVVACGHPGAPAKEQDGALTLLRVAGRSTVFPAVIWRQWRGLVPDADVVLEVVNGITFLTPLWLRTPRVTLLHHIHRDHYARELGTTGRVAALLLETLPLKLLYRRARFLTISESSAREIAHHGIRPEHIEVSYMGVDQGKFRPDSAMRAATPTLLYLGRLKRYKRIEVVLDVLEQIPEATLEIAGEGDHRPALEAEIARRGLQPRVCLHGHVSEERKVELYQRAWVNITTSAAEGWGLSITEAGACATPSAALRLGGLQEAIDDGRTGVLGSDPADLAGKVAAVVRDPRYRDALGRAAQARASEFSWDATARRTLQLLDDQRRRARPDLPPAAGLVDLAQGDGARDLVGAG